MATSFLRPLQVPELSVACFGTHDADSVVVWWETRDDRERRGERESMMARVREGLVQRTHGRGDVARRSRGRGER